MDSSFDLATAFALLNLLAEKPQLQVFALCAALVYLNRRNR